MPNPAVHTLPRLEIEIVDSDAADQIIIAVVDVFEDQLRRQSDVTKRLIEIGGMLAIDKGAAEARFRAVIDGKPWQCRVALQGPGEWLYAIECCLVAYDRENQRTESSGANNEARASDRVPR